MLNDQQELSKRISDLTLDKWKKTAKDFKYKYQTQKEKNIELALTNQQLNDELINEAERYMELSQSYELLLDRFNEMISQEETFIENVQIEDILDKTSGGECYKMRQYLKESQEFSSVLKVKMPSHVKKRSHRRGRPTEVYLNLTDISGSTSLSRKTMESESLQSVDLTARNINYELDVVREEEEEDIGTEILHSSVCSNNVPLFEHFLVVGVPREAADELAVVSVKARLKALESEHRSASTPIHSTISRVLAGTLSMSSRRKGPVATTPSTAVSGPPPPSPMTRIQGLFSSPTPAMPADTTHTTTAAIATASSTIATATASSTIASKLVMSPFSPAAHQTPHPPELERNSGVDPLHGLNPATFCAGLEGHQTVDPVVLFRYPSTVAPPPPEINDFCIPHGARLKVIPKNSANEETIMELFYGGAQSKRSARSFVFVLNDSSSSELVSNDSENSDGRRFCICVLQPRLIKAAASYSSTLAEHSNGAELPVPLEVDVEASVCFAFITRFPLFDFFFQVIYDMLSLERLRRMHVHEGAGAAAASSPLDGTIADGLPSKSSMLIKDRASYEYLNAPLLLEVMHKLARLHAPKPAEAFTFSVHSSIGVISASRLMPTGEELEHLYRAAEWALPPLLAWLPLDCLLWTLGLLICEAKILVVGSEAGMVSCAVMGLSTLLRPLTWVAPFVPIMTVRHLELVESPTPILCGLVVSEEEENGAAFSLPRLLQRCSDGSNVCAVLHVGKRDLFVPQSLLSELPSLLLPGANILLIKMQEELKSREAHMPTTAKGAKLWDPFPSRVSQLRSSNPQYTSTPFQRDAAVMIRNMLRQNIQSLALSALNKNATNQVRRHRTKPSTPSMGVPQRLWDDPIGFDEDEEDSSAADEDSDSVDTAEDDQSVSMRSVDRGRRLEDASSIVGSEGASKGYTVLALSGVALDTYSRKSFLARMGATQMLMQYSLNLDGKDDLADDQVMDYSTRSYAGMGNLSAGGQVDAVNTSQEISSPRALSPVPAAVRQLVPVSSSGPKTAKVLLSESGRLNMQIPSYLVSLTPERKSRRGRSISSAEEPIRSLKSDIRRRRISDVTSDMVRIQKPSITSSRLAADQSDMSLSDPEGRFVQNILQKNTPSTLEVAQMLNMSPNSG